jgi:hypothetical protein
MLLSTRAAILWAWDTMTSGTQAGTGALRAQAYDLLVLCQTVPDDIARSLIALATELNPNVKVLIYSAPERLRNINVEANHEKTLENPKRLIRTVTQLLEA